MIEIRPERSEDVEAIKDVNDRAFGASEESSVIEKLRRSCDNLLSLVAVDDGRVVGHILFSPATIEGPAGCVNGMGLAPMAVLPERQRKGIGSELVRSGLAMLRQRACPFVIVVGHPEYYPRFDFVPASRHGIACQWPGVPDEAFMLLVLDEAAMSGVSGIGKYRSEFDAAM